ncbi:MAG TPA: DUF2314 domain-containing protein [Spirochaetota bacterium]|nr:DUF2314 domain-containing protein [Spirochaetota bacterium]HPY02313.1 DUF2314 domain-containing protein [Spirochaetota bacterium]
MIKFTNLFLLTAATLTLSGCNKFESIFSNKDGIVSVQSDDQEMNQIIKNARDTTDQFLKAMKNPADDESNFIVKYPFKTDEGSELEIEHMWITDITIENNIYYGILNNEPVYIKDLKLGDKVKFDIKMISDWMYYKGDKIIGGKSVKYLLEKSDNLSDSEKQYLEMFK